jgi:hypothetical protein
MIEKKTFAELYRSGISGQSQWVSVESLILELKQFLNEDINSPIEDCYLFSRIESLIKELKRK